ncbi:glycosyltransferase family 39 protein [bacterium]|nr:glycosyltransferase family 39 protein [bacterium]
MLNEQSMNERLPSEPWLLTKMSINTAVTVIIIGYTTFLCIFGGFYHPIEEVGSAEFDLYVEKADSLLDGTVPKDKFHPLLYPILSAGLSLLIGDTFIAARTISSLSAGLFLYCTYLLGSACFSKKAGLFALLALICNSNVILEGLHVTTDMTFAAFTLLTLVFCVKTADQNTPFYIPLFSLSFALAYFTRYSAIALIPTILFALLLPLNRQNFRSRLKLFLLFLFFVLVFLTPHFILSYLAFGKILYDENWENLAYQVVPNHWIGGGYHSIDGVWDVVRHYPTQVLTNALTNLKLFMHPCLMEIGGGGRAGYIFIALLCGGMVTILRSWTRKRVMLLIFIVSYVSMHCVFYTVFHRFLLPVLSLFCLYIGHFLFTTFVSVPTTRVSLKKLSLIGIHILFFLSLCGSTADRLHTFITNHPVAELAKARILEQNYGQSITVAGRFPYIQRYVKFKYMRIPLPYGRKLLDYHVFYGSLQSFLLKNDVDFILISDVTAYGSMGHLLHYRSRPAFLDLIMQDEGVAVYKVNKLNLSSQ